jgi:hypothetical protein
MEERSRQRPTQAQIVRSPGGLGTIVAILVFSLVLGRTARRWLAETPARSWSAAPVWQGMGLLHAAEGTAYPLFLKLRFERKHQGAGPTVGKTNLIGTALLCEGKRGTVDMDVSGTLDAWFVENGKQVTLYLRTERNANPKLIFLLYGSWQGSALLLEDRGTLGHLLDGNAFERAGRAAVSPQVRASRRINSEITLHYAERDEFDNSCPAVQPSSPE